MQLRQFACAGHILRNTEDRLDICEGVQDAVGRFIKNVRHLAPHKLFKRGLALACLGRKKAVEGKSLCWKATRNQAADCSIRTGNRKDINTGGDGRAGNLSSWIGTSGRAR